MNDLAYLNKYLFKYKFQLILGTFFIIIANYFSIVPAVLVRYSFDLLKENYELFKLFDGFDLQTDAYALFVKSIWILGTLILIAALLRGVFMFFMRQTIIVMSRLIEYDLKNEIFEHYQSLPLSFYRKNNTGDLMNRISEDVSKVRMYFGPAIMYGITLLTLFLMVIPFMFSINFKLAIYSFIPLPILSLSIYFVNNIIHKRSEKIQESLSNLSTFVQEAFSGIRVIKAFDREEDINIQFEKESTDYKKKSLNLAFVQAVFFPLIMSLIGLSVILTIYIGGIEVFNGNISTGIIAEFIIYVNLLTWPVAALGWITSIIQQAAASQKRINEFLKTKTDIISTENLIEKLVGTIEFKNVDFIYPISGIHALKNISFKVNQGESVAIIGNTGSGKSTLANLICRMYDISSGSLKIDERSIQKYNLSCLRSQIGLVPQDVFLFSESIANNIAFGNPKMNEEKIIQAAKDADLLNNISDLPNGFDTWVGERGITLSGGQKQRVSIARAVAREPKILILDDALSAVDTKTENTILDAMTKIMKGRTSLIISHRISSAKLASKIIVLQDGFIVEQGSHESLLENDGVYKAIYDKQLVQEKEN
ncbi:MAG: ABC transporter [Flammeovirgaceae bacterium]|nr:ABC transporter [Flammeovirgaceae bacterium]